MEEILKCPVCSGKLSKVGKSFKCKNSHNFDIAKKGYVNLLLPNQTHSDLSGDSKEMIMARENFLATGKYNCLKEFLAKKIYSLSNLQKLAFGDMACGEGYYTCFIHQFIQQKNVDCSTFGIDISKSGINECSIKERRMTLNNIQFIIGNLMFLPFLNDSFDVLLNCFAKINCDEFLRVLKKGGYYIRVLPGEKHLYELKQVLYKNVILNEEKEEKLDGFTLIEKHVVDDVIELNNFDINNLFKMTPYYYKSPLETSKKLESMEYLKTQISFNILIYKKN